MRKLLIGILLIGILLALNLGPILGSTATVNPSGEHKCYYFGDASSTNWGLPGGEVSEANYNAMANSDDTRYISPFGSGKYSYVRVDFNLTKICNDNGFTLSDITNLNVGIEGMGSYGISCAVYDDTDTLWRNTNSSEINGVFTTGVYSDVLMSFDINGSIDDYVSSDGILKTSTRTNVTADTCIIDYMFLTVTYTPTPSVPVPVSPASGSTISTTGTTLDWNASTGGTAPITYGILLDADPLFGSPDVNVTAHVLTNYTVSGLSTGTWYWKVWAIDSNATPVESAACATQTFAVILPSTGGSTGGGAPYVPPEDLNLSAVTIDAGNDNLPGWTFLENPLVRAIFYIFLLLLVVLGLTRNRVDLALVSAGLIFFSWITRLGDRLNFQNLSFQAKTLSIVDFQLGNAEWNIPVGALFLGYVVFAAFAIEWLWPYLHRKNMDRRTKSVAWRYAVGTLALCMFLYYTGFRIG